MIEELLILHDERSNILIDLFSSSEF